MEKQTNMNFKYSTEEEFYKLVENYYWWLYLRFKTRLISSKNKERLSEDSNVREDLLKNEKDYVEKLLSIPNCELPEFNDGSGFFELSSDESVFDPELIASIKNWYRKLFIQHNDYSFHLSDELEAKGQVLTCAYFKYLQEISKLLKFETKETDATTENENPIPKKFEELFYNPEHAEACLNIFRELQPPVIDAINNYIGKNKGIFPLWVKVLKSHKPNPIIKHFSDNVYKDLLNSKVKGLELSKDASEFRKNYARLNKNNTELDIMTILSQYSQSGRLGK